ncbi:Ppx/GppA phosphatase family protein [Nocardioides sp.]|uniref:Ppx/GppA phosphatase family protein n=1 Tax=Nocardioides sp. TaxID=35761 RepID=UPI0026316D1E|nr:Ppx/GppA phosphatase family protein [Nocardioides sp.]MDI6909146.1 Ppx/GppA phosphatase family protein [Nocardioides sp.]
MRVGPVAAIDCGTNTIKLLVGTEPEEGGLEVDEREMRIVRLGQDLDRTGRIAEEALARAFAAIEEYAALIRDHGVPPERIRFVATSATRDAANAADFVAGVRDRLGVEPEVVSGAEEAALAFDGAVRNLRTPPTAPVLVVDIGGGSTELVLGSPGPEGAGSVRADSMNVGSVRLYERHLAGDPPTPEQVAACVADVDAHLDASPVDPAVAATVVGVAGTITTVAAAVLDLPAYDRDALDQAVLAVDDVHAAVDRLVAMTHEQRRALGFMHPGRADVIGAGALILSAVLRRTRVDHLVVSESDILDGIAWSIGR